jgi:putative thioredoxin
MSDKPVDNYDTQLVALLDSVKDDEAARQQYLDILELMGPDDERTAGYRRKLTNRLF